MNEIHKHKLIIIGGGPAGISTALFLAHAAPEFTDRILVLEKHHYPREKYCAGALGGRGDQVLATIGVVVDVPSVAISGIAVRVGDETRIVEEPQVGRVVRRVEFDHALVNVARARQLSVREGVRVTGLTVTPGGVTVKSDQGNFDADVVVGADGVGSIVRREMGISPTPFIAQALEVDTEHVASDFRRDLLTFDLSRRNLRGYYWDFPTLVDGRALVCRGVYALKPNPGEHGPEIDDVLAEELAARGLSLSSYRKKRYSERGFHRTGQVSSPRVVLVGEAAGVDPVTGEGIAQAIHYGREAGEYLSRKLRAGDVVFDDWAASVRRASIGRDLLVRSALAHVAYGPHRPAIERFLLDTPDFLRVGLQHFGGRRWSKRAVTNSAAAAVVATLKGMVFGGDNASTSAKVGLP